MYCHIPTLDFTLFDVVSVADPGLSRGGQGAKFLVMTLCLGSGGPKVLFLYILSYAKGEKLGPGGHGPQATPPGSATAYGTQPRLSIDN